MAMEKRPARTCSICGGKAHAKGLCVKHYQAAHYLANRTQEPRLVMTPEERKVAHLEADRRYKERNPGAGAAATRKWEAAHPEYKQVRAKRQSVYAAANREQERLRADRWRAANPERAAATRRRYYERNAEAVKAKIKEHRLANSDRYKGYSRNYKAAKRAGGGRLSRGCIPRLLENQAGLCNACSCNLSVSGYHIDHVVAISKGGKHCDENVQLLCPTCNRRKSDRDFSDFIALMETERG